MSTELKPVTKPRYRVPCASVDAEVSLDEFGIDEIRGYLKHITEEQGAQSQDDGLYFAPSDLNRIETLALCGQIEQARKLALEIVSEAIGRPL